EIFRRADQCIETRAGEIVHAAFLLDGRPGQIVPDEADPGPCKPREPFRVDGPAPRIVRIDTDGIAERGFGRSVILFAAGEDVDSDNKRDEERSEAAHASLSHRCGRRVNNRILRCVTDAPIAALVRNALLHAMKQLPAWVVDNRTAVAREAEPYRNLTT